MKKLLLVLLFIVELFFVIKLLNWSLTGISTPDDFMVALGVGGFMLIIVIVYFTIKLIKKFWK